MENLEISKIMPTFASSKIQCGQNTAGQQPAVFVPVNLLVNDTTVTASSSRNALGVLHCRLRQRVVRSFYINVLKYNVMKANEVSLGWALTQPNPAAAVQRVINNVKFYDALRSMEQQVRAWSRRKSETFTALCGTEGDVFTHGDVVRAHAYMALVIVIMCVAGWLEGGAV